MADATADLRKSIETAAIGGGGEATGKTASTRMGGMACSHVGFCRCKIVKRSTFGEVLNIN